MSRNPSPPDTYVSTAMARMSESRCLLWRSMRGSGTDLSIPRHPFRTRLSSLAEAACAAPKLFPRSWIDISSIIIYNMRRFFNPEEEKR